MALPAAGFSQINQEVPQDTTIVFRLRDAVADSNKSFILPAVQVTAESTPLTAPSIVESPSAKKIYADDGMKSVTNIPGLYVVCPILATPNLYGLSTDQTARPYILDHKIMGRTTLLFGGYSIVNPDIMDVSVEPSLFSSKYREVNGVFHFNPKKISETPLAAMFSTDGIERRGTVSVNFGSESFAKGGVVTSVRQNQLIGLLSAIDALKVLPKAIDSQTYAKLELPAGGGSFQLYSRFGQEKNDLNDKLDGKQVIFKDANYQELLFLQYELPLSQHTQLSAGMGWEKNSINSSHEVDGSSSENIQFESETFSPRLELSLQDHKYTFWLAKNSATTIGQPAHGLYEEYIPPELDERIPPSVKKLLNPPVINSYTSTDIGGETQLIFGKIIVKPNATLTQFRDRFAFLNGITVSMNPGRTTVVFGYGTYADYFVYNNGFFQSVLDPGAPQTPQRATHFAITAEYKPEDRCFFDVLRVSAVKKNLDVDLLSGRNHVKIVSGDVSIAKTGDLNYEASYSYTNARQGDDLLVGSIDHLLRIGTGYNISPSLNLSVEANYRSGFVTENKDEGSPHYGEHYRLAPAAYINIAGTKSWELFGHPLDMTATFFNATALIGSRAEIARINGRLYTAPFWANLRLVYKITSE